MSPIQQAYARLSDSWQPLSDIKLTPSSGSQGFAELVWCGLAEERREQLKLFGVPVGERIFYRKMTP